MPDWRWEDPALSALALGVDYLGFLAWSKTKDAEKDRNRPDPFPRPNIDAETESDAGDDFVAVSSDELDRILSRERTTT